MCQFSSVYTLRDKSLRLVPLKFNRCLKLKRMCEWKALITLHCKKKVIIKTRMSLVKKAEHTDTF